MLNFFNQTNWHHKAGFQGKLGSNLYIKISMVRRLSLMKNDKILDLDYNFPTQNESEKEHFAQDVTNISD